jgi:hypothetical protein
MTILTARPAGLQVVRRSLLLALCLCACSDIGLGVPGTGTPLPQGGLPASQTLEGGAQIRLTQIGFQKITNVLPAMLHDGVGPTVCVAQQSIGNNDVCYTNQGACSPGCSFGIGVDTVNISITNLQTLNVAISAPAIAASIQVDPPFPFSACTVSLTTGRMSVDADIPLSIDPATGVFVAEIAAINTVDFGNVSHSGCNEIPERATIVNDVLDSLTAAVITDVLTALNAALNAFMPTQPELAALVDLPALALTGFSASNGSAVETRVVPGGYAQLNGAGLSLGVVTGFNSDADPQTRSVGLVSEPHPCMTGLSAPDLSLPPFAFPTTSRGTFALLPDGMFVGAPEPTNDLLVGVSRSALDLAGHHMVASGGMCLTLDAGQAAFIRRDILDDLLGVPLAAADAELRFVVRPQQGIHFTVGAGSVLSPHLSAELADLEIDVDTVSAGTATPALTLTADVAIGSQLGTRHDAGLPARLETTRSSLTVGNPAVAVFDARYAAVNAADLDALAATIIDVVFSTLGADAGTVLVAEFGGFSLQNIAVERVTTATDDFLAVSASLGGTPPIINPPAPTPQSLSTTLVLPTPAELRAALLADDSAGLPTLHVELPTTDGARPLEHAWRTAGGAWRAYAATGDLVIRDRSFAWQGERTIELRSRVVGDDSTTSPIGSTTVVIDYAPPTIFVDQLSFSTHLVVPARDALSATLEWAMGRVGESTPATVWTSDPNLDASAALALGDDIVVYVRDGVGNVAQTTVHLTPNDGCIGAAILDGAETQDVSFASNAPSDPVSACGTGDRSVWFSFVPTQSGTAQISTSGSGYSTVVSVWPQAQTCAGLTTEVTCGTNGASVPVQQGVPLLVQVQRSTPGGTGDLQIQLTPEPNAAAAAGLACAALAFLARRAHRSPGSERPSAEVGP